MTLWPILPITACFFAGMLVAKTKPSEAPERALPPASPSVASSILTPRRPTIEKASILPEQVLKGVSFNKLVDNKVTLSCLELNAR